MFKTGVQTGVSVDLLHNALRPSPTDRHYTQRQQDRLPPCDPLMPRPTRLDAPGVPQYFIQCGNDRQPFLLTDPDYLRYRSDLREIALREICAVHADEKTGSGSPLLLGSKRT
jgi:hypothetical protein